MKIETVVTKPQRLFQLLPGEVFRLKDDDTIFIKLSPEHFANERGKCVAACLQTGRVGALARRNEVELVPAVLTVQLTEEQSP